MYKKVSDNLWRGPAPDDLTQLKPAGITRIINLESGVRDLFHKTMRDKAAQIPTQFGMEETHFGLSDLWSPNMHNLIKLVHFIHDQITSGEVVLVHCAHGVDRTGIVIALYRIDIQGWEKEAAIKEMLDMGFHTTPYEGWLEKLRAFEV